MTWSDEDHTPTDEPGLRHALAHGAADIVISPPPYARIVRDGRAHRRRRAAVRSAVVVTAVVVPALTLALLPGRHPAPPPDRAAAVPAAAGPATAAPAASHADFTAAADSTVPRDVKVTQLNGPLSGIDAEVMVWLPPQYDDPAYRDRSFPVVELLPGQGAPSSIWFSRLNASDQLKPMIANGSALPFILVAPRFTGLGGVQDTGCADLPGRPKAETWLTRDVPQLVLDNFRAEPAPQHWAVAGYSAGGQCATRLAIAHPDRYGAGVSLSGVNDPAGDPTSPVGRDKTLRTQDNPLLMLRRAARPPAVALYAAGAKGDGLEDGQALAAAAEPPTTVTVGELVGPRDLPLWRGALPAVFDWLSRRLK